MELFDAPSDYGTAGLAGLADAQSSQTQFDNQAEQAIQNVLADVGTRSNVIGSVGYDPRFAQAFNLSRGLIAGNRFDNQGNRVQDLSVPSYLQPQLFGDRVDARGESIRYYSPVERYLQEKLPQQIQKVREISPTGIMMNLIDYGTRKFNETFRDNKKEEKSDVGIMENIDRADATDVQKALQFGYENNPFSGPETQTAFNFQDMLTSPGVINKGLDFVQPYLQQVVPEGFNVNTSPIINREEGTFTPSVQLEYQFPNKDFGLGSLFRNLG
jgi:hypothetical protein|tara:strand:+ start:61 stop:873 length:813 start_codon:yes stop_codon:yes gene_type:complete